jgi:hypothetical protein
LCINPTGRAGEIMAPQIRVLPRAYGEQASAR